MSESENRRTGNRWETATRVVTDITGTERHARAAHSQVGEPGDDERPRMADQLPSPSREVPAVIAVSSGSPSYFTNVSFALGMLLVGAIVWLLMQS